MSILCNDRPELFEQNFIFDIKVSLASQSRKSALKYSAHKKARFSRKFMRTGQNWKRRYYTWVTRPRKKSKDKRIISGSTNERRTTFS